MRAPLLIGRALAFVPLVVGAGCGAQTPSLLSQLPLRDAELVRPPTAAGYSVVYSFKGGKDGQQPEGTLLYTGGMLYGTTVSGGVVSSRCGCGTVFSATTKGKETVLHSFAGPANNDGAYPFAGLVVLKGKLYGTTAGGGTEKTGNNGAVYELSTSGKESLVYAFRGYGDGNTPYGSLLSVGSTLYGTTFDGGANTCNPDRCGTIFSVTTSGKEHVLYNFKGPLDDGYSPHAGLTEVNGSLFGDTEYGGNADIGTVFRISTSGKEHVVYSFKSHYGSYPVGNLSLIKGKLYGTTSGGGAYAFGTVFEVAPSGKAQVLYTFKGGPSDGYDPVGPLVEIAGNLYGVTASGGSSQCYDRGYGCGTVFKVSLSGKETVLYSFKGGRDGATPFGGLTDVDGVLFGTTSAGGSGKCAPSGTGPAGCGALFKISP